MPRFERRIVKDFVAKFAARHCYVFVMGDPDVFPQTVGELVFLVAVRALVHVSLGTVLDEGGRRLEVGLPADDARDAGLVHPRKASTSVSALAMRGGVRRMMAPGSGMSVCW